MKGLVKRSVSIAGHRTSIALEPEFWAVLDQIAAQKRITLAALVSGVDAGRAQGACGLASALRVYALNRGERETS